MSPSVIQLHKQVIRIITEKVFTVLCFEFHLVLLNLWGILSPRCEVQSINMFLACMPDRCSKVIR